MAITASGLYGPTLEKMLIDTLAQTIESETVVFVGLALDALTPDFNAHDFRNDITANEANGTGYTAGGTVETATEVTLAGGVLTYDAADVSWAASTIPNAMAAFGYFKLGGADTADPLMWLSDFITAASSSAGLFTVQWAGAGIFTIDFTP